MHRLYLQRAKRVQISLNTLSLKKLLRMIFIVTGNKFTLKTMLCDTPYFSIVDSDMHLKNNTHKHRTRCCVSPAKLLFELATSRYRYIAYPVLRLVTLIEMTINADYNGLQ
jgi:hypothetical protein